LVLASGCLTKYFSQIVESVVVINLSLSHSKPGAMQELRHLPSTRVDKGILSSYIVLMCQSKK